MIFSTAPISRTIASVIVFLIGASCGLQAQTTWIGANNGSWGTAANWSPSGVTNSIGAVANIDAALTVDVRNTGTGGAFPYTFGMLATSLAAGNVVIGNTGFSTEQLTAQVAAGSPILNVANNGTTIYFYSYLFGSQGFTKTGAGKFTFRFNPAIQPYLGNVVIGAGILV